MSSASHQEVTIVVGRTNSSTRLHIITLYDSLFQRHKQEVQPYPQKHYLSICEEGVGGGEEVAGNTRRDTREFTQTETVKQIEMVGGKLDPIIVAIFAIIVSSYKQL